jgi:hypothetical protein
MIRLTLGALVAALLIAPASPPVSATNHDVLAAAGPPWVSIEHPVNPYDATTRDAFLLVHAFRHGTPMNYPVTGTAEGIVDGQRRTVKLAFAATSRPGVYALKRQWDTKGEWTLLVSVAQGPDDRVTAVVDLATGGGGVAAVRVPTRLQGNYTIPAAVAMNEVEASLRSRAQRVATQR